MTVTDRYGNALATGSDTARDAYVAGVDLFLAAAKNFDVSPDQCVVIEDSLTGVLAAKAAKMKCFGYAPHGGESLADNGAILFDDMSKLPALMGL